MLEHVGTVRRMPGWKDKTDAVFRRPRRWWEFEGFFDAQDTNERLFRLCLHTDELLAFEISKSLGRQNRWLCVAEPNFNTFQHHFSIISAWFQHHFSHFMFSSKMLCILSWWSQRSSCAGNGRCWWRRTINVIIVQGQKCLPSTYFETSILLILWSYDRSNVQRIIDYSAKSIFLSLRGSRVAALEMELNLVRSRFARETVMRGPWSHWTGCSDARGVSGNRVWICMVLHELWVKESLAIISRRYYLMAWLSLWAFWPEPVAT